jgi:hypothetical protein
METHRVTLEFDVRIDDDEQAKTIAGEMMRMIAEQNTPEGGQIVTSRGESPEVALHGLAQSPPHRGQHGGSPGARAGVGGIPLAAPQQLQGAQRAEG